MIREDNGMNNYLASLVFKTHSILDLLIIQVIRINGHSVPVMEQVQSQLLMEETLIISVL